MHFKEKIYKCFPELARKYRYVKESLSTFESPRQTPMGFYLTGKKKMINGQFEPEETQIVTKILAYIDVVVNVGANVGYYCCIALSQGKYVVAFEPIPLNVQRLLQNVKANNWESQIEIYPIALSNSTGVIEIYGSGTGASLTKGQSGSEYLVRLVPSTTLNNALGSRFYGEKCFFLVDIEGAELLMLEGASSILDMEPKPIWMMEINVSEHQPQGVTINPNLFATFQIFWKHGYEAWTADKQCRNVHSEEIEKIVESGIDTLNTHNFLFIAKGEMREFLDAL